MFELDARGKSVLIIPDLHAPYSHKDSYKFLKQIAKEANPDIIINLGDEVDGHAISFHNSIAELLSPGDELDKAIEEMKELRDIFPKIHFLESNHGSLIFRRLKAAGIPIRHLKPLHELYEAPEWTWHHDILLKTDMGDVYFCHGKTTSYGKLALKKGCSACQGHFHTKFEITWHQTATHTIFNMFCGCLIDIESMAFEYGKNFVDKPVLGAGFIHKDGMPQLIKMRLNKEGRMP